MVFFSCKMTDRSTREADLVVFRELPRAEKKPTFDPKLTCVYV